MTETDRVFTGSIPALYDRYLGPLIFEPYAAELAKRAAEAAPRRVLETAAGTGVLTRALVGVFPTTAEVVATDLNQAMLDFAGAQPGMERVAWRQADAQRLPFEDDCFDAVLCQFGVMFFPDRGAAYREAQRVLRSGGRFLFSLWDRIEENDFARVVTEAVAALFPADPPRFLARTPHSYHELPVIERELRAAGFSSVLTETISHRSRAALAQDPAIGFCQGTPLRNEIEVRAPGRLGEATNAAAEAVQAHFGPGPIEGKMQAHIITAST